MCPWLTATLSTVVNVCYKCTNLLLQFDKYPGSLSRYQQKPLTFSLTPTAVSFGQNVTVSWSIPVDESQRLDRCVGKGCVCVCGDVSV